MKTLTLVLLACTLGFLAACESVPVAPDPSLDPSGYGRALYERKCQTCHELKDPCEFSASALSRALRKYAPKAGLAKEDRPYVRQYLLENSAETR
ncbi:MAG: hypothetical protein KDB90_12340 [Planctomycetes bacterium]|nr:hypothetical protein [Planctomycetota bacterium]